VNFQQFNPDQAMMLYIANMLASAFVQSLLEPTAESSGLYKVLYKFLSLVVTDFKSFSAAVPVPPGTVAAVEHQEPQTQPAKTSVPADEIVYKPIPGITYTIPKSNTGIL
jgi:hypothetical protein